MKKILFIFSAYAGVCFLSLPSARALMEGDGIEGERANEPYVEMISPQSPISQESTDDSGTVITHEGPSLSATTDEKSGMAEFAFDAEEDQKSSSESLNLEAGEVLDIISSTGTSELGAHGATGVTEIDNGFPGGPDNGRDIDRSEPRPVEVFGLEVAVGEAQLNGNTMGLGRRIVNSIRNTSPKYVALILKVGLDSFNFALSFAMQKAIRDAQNNVSEITFPSSTNSNVIELLELNYTRHLAAANTGAITDSTISAVALTTDFCTMGNVLSTQIGRRRSAAPDTRSTYLGLGLSCTLSLARIIDFAVTHGNVVDIYHNLDDMIQRGAAIPTLTHDSLSRLNIEVLSAVSVSSFFLAGMVTSTVVLFVPVQQGHTIYDILRTKFTRWRGGPVPN